MSRNTIISVSHPPGQLLTWEYHRQNRTILLDVNGRFWSASGNPIKKSTLIAGFQTCKEQGTSGGSKPVHIGDLHMGLISHLHHAHCTTASSTVSSLPCLVLNSNQPKALPSQLRSLHSSMHYS